MYDTEGYAQPSSPSAGYDPPRVSWGALMVVTIVFAGASMVVIDRVWPAQSRPVSGELVAYKNVGEERPERYFFVRLDRGVVSTWVDGSVTFKRGRQVI